VAVPGIQHGRRGEPRLGCLCDGVPPDHGAGRRTAALAADLRRYVGEIKVLTRILCVDDEPNILLAMERQFRKQFDRQERLQRAVGLLKPWVTFQQAKAEMIGLLTGRDQAN
jgi:hypothetical protein